MKKHILPLVTTMALCSCSTPSLNINGNISNIADGKLYVALFDSTFQIDIVDTIDIIEGEFSAQLTLDAPECVVLFFDNPQTATQQPRSITIFAGNENVSIEGDVTKPDKIQTTGSDYNNKLQAFQKNIPEMDRLQKLINEVRMVGNDIDKRNALIDEIHGIQLEQRAYNRKMIEENEKSPIGPFLLCNSLSQFNFTEADSLTAVFEKYNPRHKYVRGLRLQIDNARPEYEARERVKIGKEAPDFTLPSINGEQVSLKSLRGKVVLLDFWASWCQPCRKNNKSLIETYNKFAKKGLEIVSISVDNKSDAWQKAVAEDGLKGIMLLDSANIVAATYCVHTIPHGLLIDADGIIVSTDTPMEALFKDIEKLLN